MTLDAKKDAAVAECRLHAAVIRDALNELHPRSFDLASTQELSTEHRRLLDQLAYRCAKLQDSMVEKVLPAILVLAEEPLPPQATFAEKLQRLERLGAIGSVEEWRELREIRNQIAHDYIDQPALRAATLKRFIKACGQLLTQWSQAEGFLRTLVQSP